MRSSMRVCRCVALPLRSVGVAPLLPSSSSIRTLSASSSSSSSSTTSQPSAAAVASIAAATSSSFLSGVNAPRARFLSEIGPDRPFGSTLLRDYPATFTIPIAWGEQDAFNHVNNVIYIRHFESARIALFMTIAHLASTNPSSAAQALTGALPDDHFLSGKQIGPILRNVSCRFKYPVTWPDYITVGTRIEDIQSDRFTLRHCSISHQHKRVCAEGDDTCVVYDYRTLSKAVLPHQLQQVMKDMFYHQHTAHTKKQA